MKIGIDLTVLTDKPTGIGNYAYFLTREMVRVGKEYEWVLFVNAKTAKGHAKNAKDENLSRFSDMISDFSHYKFVSLPPKRIPVWDAHVKWAGIMRREKLDVLWGPANVLPMGIMGGRGVRGERGTKLVLTIHDLAIYKHPEWFARGQWFAKKIVVPRSIKKADHIIVPSLATKRDLMEMFHVAENKIAVIPHGVGERYFGLRKSELGTRKSDGGNHPPEADAVRPLTSDLRHPESGRYILFVGTIEPRKNVARLIEAYTKLPQDLREKYDLVIAGKKGWGESLSLRSAEAEKQSHGIATGFRPRDDTKSKVKYLNYVPDDQLPALYQNASLFVYPSLYEGFGLPVLEAMAAGAPTICSKQIVGNFILSTSPGLRPPSPGLPASPSESEVGGRGRGEVEPFQVVDAYSVEEIRDAMERVLRDEKLQKEMGEKGRQWARQFTWEKAAAETLRVFLKFQTTSTK